MSELTEAKLEYSIHSDMSGVHLLLRKRDTIDRERGFVGEKLPIRREDLDTLKTAIRQFFGDEVWPEACLQVNIASGEPIPPVTAKAIQDMYVKMQPGLINHGAGTCSHWQPEASQPGEPYKACDREVVGGMRIPDELLPAIAASMSEQTDQPTLNGMPLVFTHKICQFGNGEELRLVGPSKVSEPSVPEAGKVNFREFL